MANGGYIGKISALVTASTADLERKLRGSATEVDRFGKSIASIFRSAGRSAEASLNGIFTQQQKVQRALDIASRSRLSLLKPDEVARIQRAVSVAEGINKPLASAQRQFVSLSAEVQANFLPALVLAQTRVAGLNDLLARSGNVSEKSFTKTAERVERTTQAIQRLTQAQRAASAGFTGNELEFSNPRALEAINSAAAASQRAAALPAAQREDPGIAARVRQLSQFRALVAQTVAQVESLKLTPNFDSTALESAERRLNNIIETTRRAQQELDDITVRAGGGQTPADKKVADNEIALLQRREQTAKQVEQQRLAAAQRAADNEIALLQRREQARKQADQASAAAAQRAADNEIALLQRREQTAKQVEQQRLAAAQRAADNEIALLQRREQAAKQVEQEAAAAAQRTADNEIALLQRREQAAKQSETQRLADAQRIADNEVALLQRREQAAKRVEQEAAAAAQRAADNEIALLQRREQAAKQVEQERLARQQRAEDNEIAAIIRREQAARDAGRAGAGRVSGLTGNVNIDSSLPAQAQRDIDALGARVGAVRQQLETLPNSVRTGFIPELQRAQAQLVRLQNSPQATVQAIENATQRVQRLEAAARRASEAFNFRQSFGGAGLRGIEEGLNQQALRGYTAQLQLLQQTLAGTSQAARGPAVVAFNNLRNAIADAMERGTLETQGTRRVLQQLTQEAVRAAAAAAGISPRGLEARLRRVGDIGRGAFGNLGLGVQQAVFAIDDFFSVTGGLDQRIRAAGNNISQLGFVLGGTAGLIGGVAVSLGAQLLVALIKFSNANVGAEDRIKALNDALARQRSLVDELKSAYEALADSIRSASLSPNARRQGEIRSQVDDIRRRQDEQVRERAAGLDPEVQRQRGIQAARQRELEQTENPARRVLLQRQIEEAARLEREAADRAARAPALSPLDAARRAIEAARRVEQERLPVGEGGPGDAAREEAVRRRAEDRRRAAEARLGPGVGAAEQFNRAREIVQGEIRDLTVQAAERGAFGEQTDASRAAERELLELVQVLNNLERNLVNATNSAAATALGQALRAGDVIGEAQQRLANVFEGRSSEIGAILDGLGLRLAQLTKEIEAAQISGDLGRAQAAQAEIDAIRQQADSLKIATQALDRFAEALNRASQEAQADLQSAQQAADQARRDDLGFSTPATRQARAQADADLARQRELATGVEVEVASARERFGERTREVQELRRRAELAARAVSVRDEVDRADREGRPIDDDLARRTRQVADEVAAGLGLNRDNQFDFWKGVRKAIDAYEAVVNEAASETERALARIAEIDAQLDSVGVLAPGRRDELVRERARLEQQAVESDEKVRAAQDEAASERRRAESAVRGRDLSLTDGERAGEQLTRQLEDIRQFFSRQAEAAGVPVDLEAQAAAQARITQDAFRAAAPALAGIADSVANAIASGPSRAALNVSDASTVEGQRELNRLLRGDDPARDQNLAELARQTQVLEEIKAKLDPPAVAN